SPVAQGSEVRATVAVHVGFVRSVATVGSSVVESGEASVAELFNGRAAAGAAPISLDPQWVSSLVGVPVRPANGARLEGPKGLAIGAMSVPTGAATAFDVINRLPAHVRERTAAVGDE